MDNNMKKGHQTDGKNSLDDVETMYNPLDENCTETRCRVLENVEHFVFAFFCAEMVIKMVAMGVTGNRVISNNNYLTIIRAFRVLRPLRAINKVPSIRILVTLLLDTLPMLGNVLLLSFLIFFVFGIISVQLWQGKLRNRCFTNFPENSSFFTRSTFYKPSFDEPDFVCSLPEDGGTSRCSNISPKDTNCSGSFEDNSINWKKYYNICKEVGPNPFYDLVSFDNIGIAWIVIFQVITLEGWSDIMYFVQDAHSSLSWIYFVVLIVFQETKAREIELIESTKDEAQPNSSEPLRAVIKFAKNLCSCRTEDEPQVHHHHHHHFYHHHHFHHHMYNCYQPASPGIFHSTPTNEPSFIFPSSDIPNIQVGGDAAMGFPSNAEQCEINPDFLAPPDRVSRRNSKTSICSHTLSIHSETSSEVSFQGIVAQSKSSVTLNVPSPTANGSFFAFASSNSAQASRKNSFNESSEVSSSVTVFADINPRSVGTGTAQDKETKSKRYPKREHKPLTRPKEKDLLKHRRLSQPAHLIEMNSFPQSPNVSSYSPSEMLDQNMSCIDFSQNERNRDQSEIEKVLSCADLSISEFPLKTQGSDNQTKVTSSKPNKHPQIQRGATTQSEDDMFESLFNLRQSASYDVTARRGAWQSLRALCRKVAASKHFTFFIMPDFLTDAMEITNKIFVCIFSFEMVIKLLGDGIAMYLSSGQNVFDGIIVIVSVCEILLSRQTSALSVFRSIRLLRIFKLVRPVRYQLLVVIKTMTSVMTFFGLLFLFIFAFAILGMNLFGGKFEFPNKEGKSILTQENWNLVMYDGMRTTNKWAALYFTALMAIGYYVLFNLLVAILVEGFTNTGTEEQKGQNSNSGKEDTPKISKTFYGSQNCCPGGYYHDDLPEFCGHGLRNALGSTFRLKTNNFNTNSFASLKQDQAAQRKLGKRLPDKSDYTRESLETYRLTMPELKRMRKVPASMILKIERIPQNTADNSSTNKRGFVITGNDVEDRRACISTKDVANFPVEATLKNMLEDEEERGYCSHESTGGDQWRDIPKASLPDPVGRQVNADRQTNDDMFRCRMASVCGHKYFDYVVLLFILISCIVLAMEEPNILPKKRQIIDATMLLLTVVAHGFVVGPGTYLKDGWNVLDGSLVLVSLIDVIITYRSIFTLSRTSASEVLGTLKLVVQTLLYSLKPIGNTVLIAAIFFVMFGILGVQIFKGKFHYCKGNDNALISLFVFSTRDGWVKIMHNGIDAVGIDQQPITNYAEWRLVYFIPFLMLGGFLVLNMIVGVVVENFQRCRERLEDEEKQKKRKKLLGKVKTEKQEDDKRNYSEGYSKWRLRILGICLHPYWDVSIAIVILVNSLEVFVEIANYFFTGVFVWNLVDLVIVVLSLAGIIIESLNSARNVLKIMINPTLVKLAKGVRSLLDTLLLILDCCSSFYFLSILVWGFKCCPSHPCQGLGPHAHFRDFGTAMLTLFRIATGDNWNGILEDTLRCSSEDKCEEYCCVSKYTAPLFFFTFVLAAQFVLVNVVIAVLMKHLKESKEKIAANMAIKDLEKKLKLLTLSAKNFIKAKARRSDPVTTSRRQSIVQLGLSGIELVQLRQSEAPETVKKSAFCTDLARADAIFQEFLRLNDSLRMVKMTIVRTSSHNTEHVTPTPVTQYPRRRRNTLSGIRELQKTSSNLKKYTVYKSGTEL
ncbi:Voltage-dependent T-type calcium channel subunit alpha-1G [Acropora cervicornis]|uniref:Voltage-dependent T-type calcium channel subunit alpha-1G n=1 Tax=Acropora cervicornis TaxID=6130 RepID=A0AAD9R232_ACRCE|nr:Voltage-dependent T-type calcium channel subunit alpha-1G [Acropora cervicornis]